VPGRIVIDGVEQFVIAVVSIIILGRFIIQILLLRMRRNNLI